MNRARDQPRTFHIDNFSLLQFGGSVLKPPLWRDGRAAKGGDHKNYSRNTSVGSSPTLSSSAIRRSPFNSVSFLLGGYK